MLNPTTDKNLIHFIEQKGEEIAEIAARVQSINPECHYQVVFKELPDLPKSGYLDTKKQDIIVNLSKLRPLNLFTEPNTKTLYFNESEEKALPESDRDVAYYFSAALTIFHEMRHLYQLDCIKARKVKSRLGYAAFDQHEPDEVCDYWLWEMSEPALRGEEPPKPDILDISDEREEDQKIEDIEYDACMFSIYMLHRYPVNYEFSQNNKRLARMKLRYNRQPIPEAYNSNTESEENA